MSTPDTPAPEGSSSNGADELAALRARIASLEAAAATPPRPPHHRVRSFFAALLIVIGCVLAPLGLVAAWTADEIGDTDRYVATVAPLASDADVQAAVANRVTDAVMEHIDLQSLLEDVAPADRPRLTKALGKLGDSLEGAVKSFVHEKAQDVVASDAFETVWTDANRAVHTSLDRALTGSDQGAVKINENTVTLDLAPIVEQVKQRLVDAGMGVAAKIPEVHTNFTIVKADDIGKVRTLFNLLQKMGFWLPVLAVLFVAGGVLLAVHRRRTLIAAALGFAVASLLLGIGLTVFRTVYLNALPSGVNAAAAGSVYDILVRYLRTSIRVFVAIGLIVALAAWLSGPGRAARLVRGLWRSGITATRTTADHAGMRLGPVGPFVHRHSTLLTWLLVAATVVTYVLWSHPTGLVVVALALAFVFALAVKDFLGEEPGETGAGAEDGADTEGSPPAAEA
ncbi:hypothetical protein [Streptomyces fradiae]|uniref:hypothetical protein n=1 Tax=Streptomyces fradiae TaxID=1906 RepID=UPI0035118AC2